MIKIGVERFYTSFIAGYCEKKSVKAAFGIGVGSNFFISKKLFFNPEFNFITRFWGGEQQYFSLNTSLGFKMEHIHLTVGPAFTVQNTNSELKEPPLRIYGGGHQHKQYVYNWGKGRFKICILRKESRSKVSRLGVKSSIICKGLKMSGGICRRKTRQKSNEEIKNQSLNFEHPACQVKPGEKADFICRQFHGVPGKTDRYCQG